jgi:enediyne biosynthesis thioesterase
MMLAVTHAAGETTRLDNRPSYPFRHRISFEETNFTGNVYFTRHLAWQGRCRELFLAEHAPDVIAMLAAGTLHLVTLRVSCEYFRELRPLDEIEVRMSLAHLRQHRIGLAFDYVRLTPAAEPVAQGFQEIGCMHATPAGLAPGFPPDTLLRALRPYGPRDCLASAE